MRDLSDDYDDYRDVVDLEWSQQKVKEYGNKKGRVLVCELMSPYHDEEIADAGEDKSSIREAYVINEAFFACVQGPTSTPDPPSQDTRASYSSREGSRRRRRRRGRP